VSLEWNKSKPITESQVTPGGQTHPRGLDHSTIPFACIADNQNQGGGYDNAEDVNFGTYPRARDL
jgi:hypothetical protein